MTRRASRQLHPELTLQAMSRRAPDRSLPQAVANELAMPHPLSRPYRDGFDSGVGKSAIRSPRADPTQISFPI